MSRFEEWERQHRGGRRNETLTQQEFLIMLGEFRELEPRINLFFQHRIANATTTEERERLQRGQMQVMEDHRYLRDLASRDFGRRTVDWEDILRDDQVSGRLQRFRRFVKTNQLSKEIDRIGAEGVVDVARERDRIEALPLLPPENYDPGFFVPEEVIEASAMIEADLHLIGPGHYDQEKRALCRLLHRLAQVDTDEIQSKVQTQEMSLFHIATAYPEDWKAIIVLLDSPFGNEVRQLLLGRPVTHEGTTMTEELEEEIRLRMANPLYIALFESVCIAQGEAGNTTLADREREILEAFYGDLPEAIADRPETNLLEIEAAQIAAKIVEALQAEAPVELERVETEEEPIDMEKVQAARDAILPLKGGLLTFRKIEACLLKENAREIFAEYGRYGASLIKDRSKSAEQQVFFQELRHIETALKRLWTYMEDNLRQEHIDKKRSGGVLARVKRFFGGETTGNVRAGKRTSRDIVADVSEGVRDRAYRQSHAVLDGIFKELKIFPNLWKYLQSGPKPLDIEGTAMTYLHFVDNFQHENPTSTNLVQGFDQVEIADCSDWRFRGAFELKHVERYHEPFSGGGVVASQKLRGKNLEGAQFFDFSISYDKHFACGEFIVEACRTNGIKIHEREEDLQHATFCFSGGSLDNAELHCTNPIHFGRAMYPNIGPSLLPVESADEAHIVTHCLQVFGREGQETSMEKSEIRTKRLIAEHARLDHAQAIVSPLGYVQLSYGSAIGLETAYILAVHEADGFDRAGYFAARGVNMRHARIRRAERLELVFVDGTDISNGIITDVNLKKWVMDKDASAHGFNQQDRSSDDVKASIMQLRNVRFPSKIALRNHKVDRGIYWDGVDISGSVWTAITCGDALEVSLNNVNVSGVSNPDHSMDNVRLQGNVYIGGVYGNEYTHLPFLQEHFK